MRARRPRFTTLLAAISAATQEQALALQATVTKTRERRRTTTASRRTTAGTALSSSKPALLHGRSTDTTALFSASSVLETQDKEPDRLEKTTDVVSESLLLTNRNDTTTTDVLPVAAEVDETHDQKAKATMSPPSLLQHDTSARSSSLRLSSREFLLTDFDTLFEKPLNPRALEQEQNQALAVAASAITVALPVLGLEDVRGNQKVQYIQKMRNSEIAVAVNNAWSGDLGRRMYSWEPQPEVDTLFLWARDCTDLGQKTVDQKSLSGLETGFFQNDEDSGVYFRVNEKLYEAATGRNFNLHLSGGKTNAYCLKITDDHGAAGKNAMLAAYPCEKVGRNLEKSQVYFSEQEKRLIDRETGSCMIPTVDDNSMNSVLLVDRRTGFGFTRQETASESDTPCSTFSWADNDPETNTGRLKLDNTENLCLSVQPSPAFYRNTLTLHTKVLPVPGESEALDEVFRQIGTGASDAEVVMDTKKNRREDHARNGRTVRQAVLLLNSDDKTTFDVNLTPCMLAEIFQTPVLDIDRRARQAEDLLPPVVLTDSGTGELESLQLEESTRKAISDEITYLSSGEKCGDVCAGGENNFSSGVCAACEPRHSYFSGGGTSGTTSTPEVVDDSTIPRAYCCKDNECPHGMIGGKNEFLCMVPYPSNRLPFAGIGSGRKVCGKEKRDFLSNKFEYSVADAWNKGEIIAEDLPADFSVSIKPADSVFYLVQRRLRAGSGHAGQASSGEIFRGHAKNGVAGEGPRPGAVPPQSAGASVDQNGSGGRLQPSQWSGGSEDVGTTAEEGAEGKDPALRTVPTVRSDPAECC
ncbi:unnamed protein product [Amoebophrya sp. A120]|nr:unnamed protein product [Amoebophrya sp. A120]|eukprot:GSA120T00015729001.1